MDIRREFSTKGYLSPIALPLNPMNDVSRVCITEKEVRIHQLMLSNCYVSVPVGEISYIPDHTYSRTVEKYFSIGS